MDIQLEYNSTGAVVGANFYPYYDPSIGAASLFVALFTLASLAHIALVFRCRSKFFIFLVVGGIMEAIGYVGRALAHGHTHTFAYWVLQMFMIMCSPPLISVAVYMSFSRIVQALDARSHAILSPRVSTPLFVTSDIIALFTQLSGIGLQAARTASAEKIGEGITLAGLVFQVVLFTFFIVNVAVFHKRILLVPTRMSAIPELKWTRVIAALYVASGAILLRNIVRLAEYAQPHGGIVTKYEVFIYLFDALPMCLGMAIVALWYPGRLHQQAQEMRMQSSPSMETSLNEKQSDAEV